MRWCVFVLILAISACAKISESNAVASCTEALAERLKVQMGELDTNHKYVRTADGTITIRSAMILRAGTSDQGRQLYTCTAMVSDDEVRVVNLEFDPLITRVTAYDDPE